MARPLRIQYPNAFYHVMNRGLGRQRIFLSDDDYQIFLETVKESCRYFDIRILSYALMPNHYHLLIQTPKANLDRAMRHLNGVYTQRFNRFRKTDGPLFRGRYKAILIQEDEYLRHLIRYIHLNPVCASLTQDPFKYPWASHKDYLKAKDQKNDKGHTWLHIRLGLAFFHHQLNLACKAYREFLKGGIDSQTRSFYSRKKQNPIFGDPDFIEMIREKYILGNQKFSTEIPEKVFHSGQKKADEILKTVSQSFDVSIQALGRSDRGQTNYARLSAVNLTRELTGLKLTEIARIFGMSSYKTVGTSCWRLKNQLSKDTAFRRRYEKVRLACSQGET
jgi:putative transposase